MPPPKEPTQTERLQQQIRDVGLRCTAARLAVLEELTKAESPLTHAEVAERLSGQGLDKATVFRNLVDLVDAQILSRTELGDHVWRFEIRSQDPHAGEHHPHFICLDCGGVTCLSELDFDKRSQQAASRVGDIKEILIKGICLDCRPSA